MNQNDPISQIVNTLLFVKNYSSPMQLRHKQLFVLECLRRIKIINKLNNKIKEKTYVFKEWLMQKLSWHLMQGTPHELQTNLSQNVHFISTTFNSLHKEQYSEIYEKMTPLKFNKNNINYYYPSVVSIINSRMRNNRVKHVIAVWLVELFTAIK